jgi:serine/threonine protein kinase
MLPNENAMLPEQIGRYHIKAELGRGGMSVVYWAHDPLFERDVTLKLLSHELLHRSTFRARFEREAKTIAALDHPAIVPVYDLGEESGQPYFVMRFMTGGSLSQRLEEGPLSLAEAARVLARLAPALDEAHAHGVIHRDLKPSNILFDQRRDAFISDFGIAKLTEASTKLTNTGGLVGTPAYMSPEQIQGNVALDGRSDIYTLGILLFEMLSGSHPYQTDTPIAVAVKHIFEPIPRILESTPNLPPECQQVLSKAMAKNRDDRYPTAVAFAAAVQALLEEPEEEVDNQPRPKTGPLQPLPVPGRRLGLIVYNGQYDDLLLGQLATPLTAVSRLHDVLLHEKMGQFDEVRVLENETTGNIRRAISHFFAGKTEQDFLLLYIIGQAVLGENGRLYLAGSNSEHHLLRGTAVPLNFITEEMENSLAKKQALILDCQFSNASPTNMPGLMTTALDAAQTTANRQRQRVILTAHNTIQYLWSKKEIIGQAAPSYFSHFFIEGLETGAADANGNGTITLDDLYHYICTQLQTTTKGQQTPCKWPDTPTTLILSQQPLIKPVETPAAPISIPAPAPANVMTPGALLANTRPASGHHQNGATANETGRPPHTTANQPVIRDWFRAMSARTWALVFLLLTLLLLANSGGYSQADTPALDEIDVAAVAVATSTATPTPTATATVTATPSSTETVLAMATMTATPAPSLTPAATRLLTTTATALEPSSIFVYPDADTAELTFVETGETVTVLGRSPLGQWFYVRTETGVTGYTFAPRFAWDGRFADLEIIEPTDETGTVVTLPSSNPCIQGQCPPLQFDLYTLPGSRCQGTQAYRTIFMLGRGGDGTYTYYWNGRRMDGPTTEGFGFEVMATAGSSHVIGTGRVISGDGQRVERSLFITNFTCE